MGMMMTDDISETAKEVVRRNTIEVQGGGNWALFDELFDDNFHDHTPQPGGKPDKAGVLELYRRLREAFPDFTPEIHWQKADGDVVTTYKTYHGSHLGNFLGVPGTGRKVSFETVGAMRVSMGGSPSIGASRTSTRSCSSLASSLPSHSDGRAEW
jgi:predicted ester cyclase